MKYISLLILLMIMAMPAHAADALMKGASLPNLSAMENQNGEQLKLYDLYGEKGVTVVFYRSAGWCPYCQKQLLALNDKAKDFEKAGYPLVGVSYDRAEILKKFDDKHNMDFPLLSDPASETIRAFGLLDDSYAKGTFAYGVPKPAIYVIDKDGKVERVYKKAGYKERPDIDVILKEIAPAPVEQGEEFPEDPTVIEGEIEVMEDTPEIIEAPASDEAVDAAVEINEATLEETIEQMDMETSVEADAVVDIDANEGDMASEQPDSDMLMTDEDMPVAYPVEDEVITPNMGAPTPNDPFE